METNEDFNRIFRMNTEAERRQIAAQIMASMMQDTPTWMLDHYISRGYEKLEYGNGYALLKKTINP